MFIELHKTDRTPILVNVDDIMSVERYDSRTEGPVTTLSLQGQDSLWVVESYNEVKRLIRGDSS